MGKAYSEDLRLKALAALDSGMKKMAVHRAYGVSRSTLDDWVKLRVQTGSLKVVPPTKAKAAALSGAVFGEFAKRHAGQTLKQMAAAWEHEQGQKLSEMSFSVALRRVGNVAPKGWTRKKRVGVTASAARTSAPSS